jgi:hypothetical protein
LGTFVSPMPSLKIVLPCNTQRSTFCASFSPLKALSPAPIGNKGGPGPKVPLLPVSCPLNTFKVE